MASRVAAWMGALVLLSVVGGCGKAEGGAAPIPLSELPTRVANLLCDSLAGCCKSSGLAVDAAACKTSYTVELQEELGEEAQRGVRYDAQAAGDCLAAASAQIQCGQFEGDDDPACDRIFIGSVALGQPCNGSRECAAVAGRSVYCESQDGLLPAVCTASENEPAAHGKAGDACGTTCFESEDCSIGVAPVPQPGVGAAPAPQPSLVACYRDDGLFCDATGHCAPLLAPGASCGAYEACSAPTFCSFTTGLCTAPQPTGSVCETDDECQSKNCSDAAPSSAADPSGVATRICVASTAVTAEQCSRTFSDTSPDSTEPGDPGSSAE